MKQVADRFEQTGLSLRDTGIGTSPPRGLLTASGPRRKIAEASH
jgi:hypothetical protein